MRLRPSIAPIEWLPAREVLADEARDFTPWLAVNLGTLAEALGLDELELIEVEHSVDNFRLDIRAVGVDASGEPFGVVIENQYHRSNHDHLGKVITYAAHASVEYERVLGVWIVEEAQPAHVAAVEFLNRTSVGNVGWVLLQVRFAPSPAGHYVHFEVKSEPNAFLKASSGDRRAPVDPDRKAFMEALWTQLEPRLRAVGYRRAWCHADGWAIRAYLPKRLPVTAWSEVRFRATKDRFRFIIHVGHRLAEGEEADAVLELLRGRYEDDFLEALPAGSAVEWHLRKPRDKSDFAHVTWPYGFATGDPAAAAEWAASVAGPWLQLVRDDPLAIQPPSSAESGVARPAGLESDATDDG